MDRSRYFKDLGLEFCSLRNRRCQLIGSAHWPSDGVWKESVLRTILRRHLPLSMAVGTRFILDSEGVSTQIDILIYDDSGPVLFRDGDFVVVTPQVVRAAIEVKTSLAAAELDRILMKLDGVANKIPSKVDDRVFVGLFAYEERRCGYRDVLDALNRANRSQRAVNAVSFGPHQFIRYWEHDPTLATPTEYCRWRSYKLPRKACGYFVHNVLDHMFPVDISIHQDLWFPRDGKEPGFQGESSRELA